MSVKTRGFAKMPKARQQEIASKGGKAAHAKGTAHTFSSEEARKAGKKGGQAPRKTARARKPETTQTFSEKNTTLSE